MPLDNPALNLQVEASDSAAPELGLEIVVSDFAVADEIEKAFAAATEQRVDAILPLSDPMALGNAEKIGALSLSCTFSLSRHSARSQTLEVC